MHVKGHIRAVFTSCLEAWDRETEWWAPLQDVGPSSFPDSKLRRQWAGMDKEDRARWLIGQLWNCTDVCPRMGNIVTLAPPLTITREELDEALAVLDASLTRVEAGPRT